MHAPSGGAEQIRFASLKRVGARYTNALNQSSSSTAGALVVEHEDVGNRRTSFGAHRTIDTSREKHEIVMAITGGCRVLSYCLLGSAVCAGDAGDAGNLVLTRGLPRGP